MIKRFMQAPLVSVVAVFITTCAAAQPAETSAYEDWVLVCEERENALPCQIRHRIIDQASKTQVLSFSIVYAPDQARHGRQLVFPLDFLLEPGVSLAVDDYRVDSIAVDYCDANGCYVEAALEAVAVEAFRAGTKAHVHLTARDGRRIGLPFSLTGFSKAEARLRRETVARAQ
ncbi:MAG: invasion associated locus B family protein [Candidatus Phaeomarinobacter sp.]